MACHRIDTARDPMPPRPLRRRFALPLILVGMGAALGGPSGCGRAPGRAAAVAPERRTGPGTSTEPARPPGRTDAARPAPRAEAGYPFTRAERSAVDDFLRRNPTLRVATDEDRHSAADSDAELRGLYGVYHPYFVRGDLDDDGVLDFVLGFVRKDSGKSAPWFSVVVFTGRTGGDGGGSFSPGTFLERDVSIARGDLAVDRDAVVITPDLADDTVRRYRWDLVTRSFLFVRDSDSDPETPGVSRTRKSLPAPAPPPRSGAFTSAAAVGL
jgi:hypothetical protein